MRSIPAARSPRGKQPPDRQHRPRRGRVALALAALASIAFLVGACGGGPASSSSTTTGGATSGTGVVIRSGSGSGSQSGGNTTTGGYSVAFAGCMRAHGVPKFPNPNGSPNQLGPDSGFNPSSSAYQAALNGPCESLAPAGWVSPGPVTEGGGS